MKTKLKSTLTLGLLSLAFGTQTFAQGNHTGGGDSVVTLADGSTVIVDPFIAEQNRVIKLNPALAKYIRSTKQILTAYSNCGGSATEQYDKDGRSYYGVAELSASLSDLSSVRLVNHLPDDPICQAEAGIPLAIDPSHPSEIAACTYAGNTYIRKDLFSKLSLIDQTSLLVHEKLHAVLSKQNREISGEAAEIHLQIFSIAGGLKTALNRLYLQQHGDLTDLSESELASLKSMRAGLDLLAQSCAGEFGLALWPHGGGLISERALIETSRPQFEVDPSVFVGIGSSLNGTHTLSVLSGTVLIGSSVWARDVMISQEVILNQSQLFAARQMRLNKEFKSDFTSLITSRNLTAGANTRVSHSTLSNGKNRGDAVGADLTLGKQSDISNTILNFDHGFNKNPDSILVSDRQKYFLNVTVKIGNQVKIDQVQMPSLILPAHRYAGLNLKIFDVRESPYEFEVSDATVIDRSENLFRGCINRTVSPILSSIKTLLTQDRDLEEQLCTAMKQQ